MKSYTKEVVYIYDNTRENELKAKKKKEALYNKYNNVQIYVSSHDIRVIAKEKIK